MEGGGIVVVVVGGGEEGVVAEGGRFNRLGWHFEWCVLFGALSRVGDGCVMRGRTGFAGNMWLLEWTTGTFLERLFRLRFRKSGSWM